MLSFEERVAFFDFELRLNVTLKLRDGRWRLGFGLRGPGWRGVGVASVGKMGTTGQFHRTPRFPLDWWHAE